MKRVTVNMYEIKQQIELVDYARDGSSEDEAELLDKLGDFLDRIAGGEYLIFLKEQNGTLE